MNQNHTFTETNTNVRCVIVQGEDSFYKMHCNVEIVFVVVFHITITGRNHEIERIS